MFHIGSIVCLFVGLVWVGTCSSPYKTYKEAYNGPNAILDVDDYINHSEDAEAAADSYDTYISAELNFPDAYRNAV